MGRSLFTNVCQTLSNWGSRLYGAQPHDDTMQVKVSGKAAWGVPQKREAVRDSSHGYSHSCDIGRASCHILS